jgi:hypothetical protein
MHGEKALNAVVIIVVIAAVVYSALFILPAIMSGRSERPVLEEGEAVKSEHIQWVVDELISGEIKTSYLTGSSLEAELFVEQDDLYFTVNIDAYVASVRRGRGVDPDIRLTGSREVIARLLAADSIFAELKELLDEGKIKLEMLKPEEEVDKKGYNKLYEGITK